MYLRTYRRKNKNGTIAKYYQLAENRPHPQTGKLVPVIIHNFGRDDQVDRKKLIRLSKSIRRVCENDMHESLFENRKSNKASKEVQGKAVESAQDEFGILKRTVQNLQENAEKYKTRCSSF